MLKLLLPLVAVGTLAAPAAAAIVTSTQTQSGSLGAAFLLPAGFSTTLSFNPFTGPGTLQSVTLSYSSGFQSDFSVSNVNIFPPRPTRQVTLVRGIEAGISGNGFGGVLTNTVSKTQTVPPNSINSFGNYAPSVADMQTSNLIDPAFFGPGQVSFAFYAKQFGNSLTGTPSLGTTLATPNLLTATSFYDVSLTYSSFVPEPSNWAMLIAGFGLVGATLRRRRPAIA
jgi:hypothetical protein